MQSSFGGYGRGELSFHNPKQEEDDSDDESMVLGGMNNEGYPTNGHDSGVREGSSTGAVSKKSLPANGKKTKGRVKIKMEFIDNKLRRYTTFSKRKTGIMKKVSVLCACDRTKIFVGWVSFA